MSLKEKVITIKGIKTVFLETGRGETLVWIPGWGAGGSTYQAIFHLLEKDYHLISPDMPGFGKADIPKKIWDLEEYGEYVSSFIDQLSLKNITLIGHSTGAAIALHTATKSNSIKRLILIGPYGLPLGQSRHKLLIRYLREFFTELKETANVSTFIKTSTNLLSIMRNIKYTLPYTLHIFDEQLQNNETLFTKITVPTLILWGKDDKIFGKDYADKIRHSLPNAAIHEVEGTHNWIIFRPQQLLSYL